MKIPCKYERLEDCSREDLINKIMVRDKHCCDLKELLDKGLKKYKELEEENKSLKNELMEDMKTETKLNEEIKKLKSDLNLVIDERDNAFKKIKQLEERLDNKEKVNNSLREELGKFVMKS